MGRALAVMSVRRGLTRRREEMPKGDCREAGTCSAPRRRESSLPLPRGPPRRAVQPTPSGAAVVGECPRHASVLVGGVSVRGKQAEAAAPTPVTAVRAMCATWAGLNRWQRQRAHQCGGNPYVVQKVRRPAQSAPAAQSAPFAGADLRRCRRKSAPAPAQMCAVFCAESAHSAPPHQIGVFTPHSGCPFL